MGIETKITEIPWDNEKDGRIESGPIRFGDDWPGFFYRGDAAYPMGWLLLGILDENPNRFNAVEEGVLRGLVRDLMSCKEPEVNERQDTD